MGLARRAGLARVVALAGRTMLYLAPRARDSRAAPAAIAPSAREHYRFGSQ